MHMGHVGLALDPPYAPQRVPIVFDPLQLQRVEPGLRRAVTAAKASPPTAPWSMARSIADVHRFLAARPWPISRPGPTKDEAEAQMAKHRADFLARPRYMRPDSHNLHVSEEHWRPHGPEEENDGDDAGAE
ncbi:hypothetical protein [Amycolatopsis rubida]|nr:hypothetical protein [Amycolatopsis rubida]OAP20426.1 hypothetical protein A4R44_08850 [Amycolatopsis sp. M39]